MDYIDEIINIINMRLGSIMQTRKDILYHFRQLSNCKKVCLFGAGHAGKSLYFTLKEQNINVEMFCDNDRIKWGKIIIDSKRCISHDELDKIKDNVICIISTGPHFYSEIYRQLSEGGFKYIFGRELFISQTVHPEISSFNVVSVSKKILKAARLLYDEQSLRILYYKLKSLTADFNEWRSFSFNDILDRNIYFIENGRYLKDNFTIVDCGAYNGDTLLYLIDTLEYVNFKRYICYEMDPENYHMLQYCINKLPEHLRRKIIAYNLGVGKNEGTVKYGGNLLGCSIGPDGEKTADIVKIDEHLSGMDIDFIKMDIEGSEMDALIGAERTLAECRPVCAVSIYHKFEDLWEIPLFFEKVMPKSRFILRHHNNCYYDTVFYAIPEERILE